MIQGWWQTDPGLRPAAQKAGCAFLSAVYWLPEFWTVEDVNGLLDAAMARQITVAGRQVPLVGADCRINDWARLLPWLPDRSAGSHPLRFVRVVDPGVGYQCEPGEREIVKWWLPNVQEFHFTPGKGDGTVAWDSMNRPDIMARYAKFDALDHLGAHCYRLILGVPS